MFVVDLVYASKNFCTLVQINIRCAKGLREKSATLFVIIKIKIPNTRKHKRYRGCSCKFAASQFCDYVINYEVPHTSIVLYT